MRMKVIKKMLFIAMLFLLLTFPLVYLGIIDFDKSFIHYILGYTVGGIVTIFGFKD